MHDGPVGLPTHLRVLRPLGGGGSATVWRARDTRRGRDVAVKLLEGEGQGDRLEQEVRALARLQAVPGAVAVLECGVTPTGRAWLVTELVEGTDLAVLGATGTLPRDRALAIAWQLAATLAAAHALGVVHGDLTPANVLVGPDGAARLTDLGLASLDGLVGAGGCTPAYAAPERLRGSPPSVASDVYSLAATLDAVTDPPLAELAACRAERPSERPDAASVAASLGSPARGRPWLRRPGLRLRRRR